jgi:hypothetical protein
VIVVVGVVSGFIFPFIPISASSVVFGSCDIFQCCPVAIVQITIDGKEILAFDDGKKLFLNGYTRLIDE